MRSVSVPERLSRVSETIAKINKTVLGINFFLSMTEGMKIMLMARIIPMLQVTDPTAFPIAISTFSSAMTPVKNRES